MHPIMTTREARAQLTFRALAAALAYPGRRQNLPASGREAHAAIAESLERDAPLDRLELAIVAPVFTDD